MKYYESVLCKELQHVVIVTKTKSYQNKQKKPKIDKSTIPFFLWDLDNPEHLEVQGLPKEGKEVILVHFKFLTILIASITLPSKL